MADTIAIKIAIGAILALILLLFAVPKLFGRAARIRRKLRATKQCAIGNLANAARGPRRIAGMVVAVGDPLIAPLTGRACVSYETQVVRAVGLGLDWDIKFQVVLEKRCVPFLIDDGTGSVVVDTAHAELLLGTDVDRWSSERDADAAAENAAAENAFLARFGQRRRGLLFEKRLHFTESIIEVGERIAVMGVPVHEPEPSTSSDSPYREYPTEPSRPRMARSSRSALVVTDDLKFAPPLDDE
ncbi:MAG: hypothetical protein H0T89_05605 [Deltaproteobacteria bacterium]|nr:hypothetical protein [Deltaproteobacteria bacterium]MDQ3299484.1 hypothetical protein [Myxococcota bacterium]